MPRFTTSLLLAAVLASGAILGCHAQPPVTTSSAISPTLARHIEVTIRSRYNVPAEYNVELGALSPSKLEGYKSLAVTFSGPTHDPATTSTATFLLSDDGQKLARIETMDLTHTLSDRINLTGRPVRGNPQAKVTVVNFDDLECPYCARMHHELFPVTADHYKGLVNFIYKDFPLVDIHPWAMHAAVDANCLAVQNGEAYWHYVDYLHEHGQEVTGADRDPHKSFLTLDRLANEEGERSKLDMTKLDACVAKQDETIIRASMHEGDSLGVDGTPSLFIDGEHINGAVGTDEVWAVIDRALKAKGITPPPMPSAAQPAH